METFSIKILTKSVCETCNMAKLFPPNIVTDILMSADTLQYCTF